MTSTIDQQTAAILADPPKHTHQTRWAIDSAHWPSIRRIAEEIERLDDGPSVFAIRLSDTAAGAEYGQARILSNSDDGTRISAKPDHVERWTTLVALTRRAVGIIGGAVAVHYTSTTIDQARRSAGLTREAGGEMFPETRPAPELRLEVDVQASLFDAVGAPRLPF